MPLSEEEQRVLEEIERQYHQTAAPRRLSKRPPAMRVGSSTSSSMVKPVALFVAGVAVLVLGFTRHPLIGLLGFLVMLTGVFSAFVSLRNRFVSGGFADLVAQAAARSKTTPRSKMTGQSTRPPEPEADPL